MRTPLSAIALAWLLGAAGAGAQPGTPAEIAAGRENAASAPYRYRVAIASLLQLTPGMVAAEVQVLVAMSKTLVALLNVCEHQRRHLGSAESAADQDRKNGAIP